MIDEKYLSQINPRPYPVYKKINGELVKIDKRDSNRDYACVSGEIDGVRTVYDLELTDEEQKKKDEDEAKFAAEKPKRDAEAKIQAEIQKKKNEEFKNSLKYEHRFVAFIDILGWRSAVEKSTKDEEFAKSLGIALTVFTGMKEQNDVTDGWFEWDPKVTHFSDSIVISVKNHDHAIDHLLSSLGWATAVFLERGLFLRGGISFGPLTHKNSILYGPALNRAYCLESKEATWPRIILDDSIAEYAGQNRQIYHNDKVIGCQQNWRVDKDGKKFFDFLPHPSFKMGYNSAHDHVMKITRDLVIRGLEDFKGDEKTYPKYFWLAEYFNTILEENSEINLEKIII